MRPASRSHSDVGLLILRIGFVLCLIFGHGLPKWTLLQTHPERFPDPLGMGHTPALLAAMAAEIGASALVGLGFCTRLAALPVIFTMTVVAVVVHRTDTWAEREPSILFGLVFLALLIMGPGRLSLDHLLRRRDF